MPDFNTMKPHGTSPLSSSLTPITERSTTPWPFFKVNGMTDRSSVFRTTLFPGQDSAISD